MKFNFLKNQTDVDTVSNLIQPNFFHKYQCNLNENVETIVENTYNDFHSRYGIEGVNISLLDDSGKFMVPYKLYNPVIKKEILDKIFLMKIPLDRDGGIAAYVVQKRESVFVSDLKPNYIFSDLGQKIASLIQIRSNLYYPLINGNNVIGILTFPAYTKSISLDINQLNEMNRFIEYFAVAVMSCISSLKLSLLIKEMNHRIKNNLQIVSYYINLGSHSLKDDESREIFKDAQRRVMNFSKLHEKLYKSDDLKNLNLRDFIEEILSYLKPVFYDENKRIGFKVNIEEIMIDVNTATYLSLMVNELITNIFKYAFKERKDGMIEILCKQDSQSNLLLTVRDNGVGLPKEFNIQESKTFGMDLLISMVETLSGQMEITSQNGTVYKITIPITK